MKLGAELHHKHISSWVSEAILKDQRVGQILVFKMLQTLRAYKHLRCHLRWVTRLRLHISTIVQTACAVQRRADTISKIAVVLFTYVV